jgi:hypothetical protein
MGLAAPLLPGPTRRRREMFIESFPYLGLSPNWGDMYSFIAHDAPAGASHTPVVTTYKHVVPTALSVTLQPLRGYI